MGLILSPERKETGSQIPQRGKTSSRSVLEGTSHVEVQPTVTHTVHNFSSASASLKTHSSNRCTKFKPVRSKCLSRSRRQRKRRRQRQQRIRESRTSNSSEASRRTRQALEFQLEKNTSRSHFFDDDFIPDCAMLVDNTIQMQWPGMLGLWVDCDVIDYKRGRWSVPMHRVRYVDGFCEWVQLRDYRLKNSPPIASAVPDTKFSIANRRRS